MLNNQSLFDWTWFKNGAWLYDKYCFCKCVCMKLWALLNRWMDFKIRSRLLFFIPHDSCYIWEWKKDINSCQAVYDKIMKWLCDCGVICIMSSLLHALPRHHNINSTTISVIWISVGLHDLEKITNCDYFWQILPCWYQHHNTSFRINTYIYFACNKYCAWCNFDCH